MKIYDTHSDIFSNLYERIKNGEQNVFEKYHLILTPIQRNLPL
jgi:hypothetical protein